MWTSMEKDMSILTIALTCFYNFPTSYHLILRLKLGCHPKALAWTLKLWQDNISLSSLIKLPNILPNVISVTQRVFG